MTRNVAIYIYDDIEVLDFAGPFEVFNTASRVAGRYAPLLPAPFYTFTVGSEPSLATTRGGLLVQPHFAISSHPSIDILIIPGGVVTVEMENPALIAWIKEMSLKSELTASVCTGAFLLAKAGLLDGLSATTHWEDLDDLQKLFPGVVVKKEGRWIDNGKIITSAGISAGLDMSLHIVEKCEGKDLALKTAKQMDYAWIVQGEEN